jgi:uncharacterized protein YkwD
MRSWFLRSTLVVVAALLPASLLAGPAVSAPSPATQYATQAFRATNDTRSAHHLARLVTDPCVQRFARAQAVRMASRNEMFHQELGPILRTCGLDLVAENVAYGYPTGTAVVRGWMGSPGHRANILNGSYRLMAVAARKGSDGRWYAAQVFGRRF